MRGGAWKRTIALLAVAGAALSAAAAVQAHTRSFATQLTIRFSGTEAGDRVSGKLSSPRQGCRRNSVVLYRVRPGADQLYGAARSGTGGRWALVPNGNFFPAGRYYAVAPRKRLRPRTAAHRHVCSRVETSRVSTGS